MSLPIEAERQGAIPPAVKKATFNYVYMVSYEANKLLPSSYLEVSKFYHKMNHFSNHFKLVLPLFIITFISIAVAESPKFCTICTQQLRDDFSVDAWGNAFHTRHEKEGLFCNSCSRIISEGVTQGGYIYPDGRHMCSLCQITAVHHDSSIYRAFQSAINILIMVGIKDIPQKIPIELVDLNQLNIKAGKYSHLKLKGFTQIKSNTHSNSSPDNPYHIFILSGLPQLEFEAVLTHELIHVWLDLNHIQLNKKNTEGFCNLGSYLIFTNDDTQFSQIHLKAMENDPDYKYGTGFRYMKSLLLEMGWKNLIAKIRTFNE